MKIIIPMAGSGKRMRPHTLTTPKPFISIAGKTILERIITSIANICVEDIEEVVFVIDKKSAPKIEDNLIEISKSRNVKCSIYYQESPLGAAHAIYCAKASLTGKIIVAFSDTLFLINKKIDESKESIIYVNQVSNWEQFGVVKIDENNIIKEFIEKPKEFISNLSIIGLYYFKDGNSLKESLQYIIDKKSTYLGEYQVTSVLENMIFRGTNFFAEDVSEWLDCGNKNATLDTNRRILEIENKLSSSKGLISEQNALIIPPCYIGDNVVLNNSIIGPFVSLEKNTIVQNSIIINSLIQSNCKIVNSLINNSILSNNVQHIGSMKELSLGEYSLDGN